MGPGRSSSATSCWQPGPLGGGGTLTKSHHTRSPAVGPHVGLCEWRGRVSSVCTPTLGWWDDCFCGARVPPTIPPTFPSHPPRRPLSPTRLAHPSIPLEPLS